VASLNELMDTTSPLESLVDTDQNLRSPLPSATARNEAALTAIQTDNPVDQFQAIMAENADGMDSTITELETNIVQGEKESDFQVLMEVLADPSTPVELKSDLVQAFDRSDRLSDKKYNLMDKALMAPSEGENLEQEAVRLSAVDTIREYYDHQSILQGLTNQFLVDNEQSFLGTAVDFGAVMVPGTEAYTNVQLTQAIYEVLGIEYKAGSKLRDAIAPGFSGLEVRDRFKRMSPDEQIEAASKILSAIKDNNAIMAGDSNQIRALVALERFLHGDYDTSDAVVDSLFNVLDLIGLGLMARSGVRAVRARKATKTAEDGSKDIIAPNGSKGNDFKERLPEARVSARADEIQQLEDEYASLLAQTQSALDPGSVRNLRDELKDIVNEYNKTKNENIGARASQYQEEGMQVREARKAAQKEKDDRLAELKGRQEAIENRLRINSQTETAAQQLKGIEDRLAAARKDTSTVPARLNPIMDSLQGIRRNSILGVENPASAGAILSNLNPGKGRSLFKVVAESPNDDVALAAFGMSKQDYMASQIFPQVGTDSGKVRARVPDVQREYELSIATDEGGLRFTDKERGDIVDSISKQFKDANGLTVHDAEGSLTVSPDGGRVKVSAMYGTSEGGFLLPEDAVDQAKVALRQFGITEDDITLMKKNGAEYITVNFDEVRGIPGDYKIRVDTDLEMGGEYLGEGWEHLNVKRNWLDRHTPLVMEGSGTVNRMVFDAASNLHPTITGSFSVATDKSVALEKILLKQAKLFSQEYSKLNKVRQEKVWNYILDANYNSIKFQTNDLIARGFIPEEIDTLKHFRQFWDMHFQLENLDVVRTLRSRNFMKLESANGDEFFARPIPKNINHSTVYDPTSGGVRALSRQELDDLYDQDGTVALLKSPIDVDGNQVQYIISRNNKSEYLRALRDDDKILNYRDGYFQINYKSPQFIREVDGDVTRAVAVRGDKLSAERERKRLSAINGKEYIVTGDDKDKLRSFDNIWDVNQVAGRIAQRRRGQLLEGADTRNMIDGKEFVENPIDSAIRAARSIAGRTITRPAMETAKARFLNQYKNLLTKDEYGKPVFPSKVEDIGKTGEYSTSDLAAARTTWEYIRRMEVGYINTIDDTYKSIMNSIANGLGEFNTKIGGGLASAEKGARAAAGVRPSGVVRGTVFQALIAQNPLRNWILQPMQGIRTLAYNPKSWMTGDMMKYPVAFLAKAAGMNLTGDLKLMTDALANSGMLDAVDRSNLIRGAMIQTTDASSLLKKGAAAPLNFSRIIGFDFGEKINLVAHYSSVWSKYKRAGYNMADPKVQAQVHSETRAISLEMNRAGDMAYNENFMSIPMQFAQIPHKFLLTQSNRRIPVAARRRMALGDIVMFGVPGTYMLTQMLGEDVLPEDPQMRDEIVSGLVGSITNRTLRAIFNDNTNIDFSSLAPYELGGFADMIKAGFEGGISEIISNSPAGTLFAGQGRVGAAFKSLFRHFSPIEEGLETPETMLDTVNQIAKISSGWNNATKSWMAATTGMATDKYNFPTDQSVTIAEAVAMAVGFPTKDTTNYYQTISRLIDNKESNKQIAKDIADSIFQMYASAYGGENALDPQYVTRISGALLHLANENPILAKEVYNQITVRFKDPNDKVVDMIVDALNMPTVHTAEYIIRSSSLPDHEKEALLKMLDLRKYIIEEED
jgi:hypothetical protein